MEREVVRMKLVKNIFCTILVSFVLIFLFSSTQTSYVYAKRYSENGTWKKTIKDTSWYFDINDYTSRDPGRKYYGVVYIYKGKSRFDNHKHNISSEYYKIAKNKYKIKYSGGSITFNVKKKTIILKQVSGSVGGVKLNGKFKLVKRHYS